MRGCNFAAIFMEKHQYITEKTNLQNMINNSNREHLTDFMKRRMERWQRRARLFDECRPDGSDCRRVSREELAQGRKEMCGRLIALLGVADRDNYYWVEAKSDLIEMAYETWLDGTLRDPQGNPISYAAIARRVFAKLHMPLPRNIYSVAARARARKGITRTTMLDRYCFLRYVRGKDDPLADDIIRLSV